MAHDRRSMLASHNMNNYSMAGVKPSKAARPSGIPRHSILPSRVPSSSGQENNMLNASNTASAAPRSSMAVGMGYPGAASATYNMDIDMGASSSAATPHRTQAAQTRRVESIGRMSIAPTPNTRKSMAGRQSLAPRPGGNLKPSQPIDPRNVREDRQLLFRMETEIQDFLADTGFIFPAKYSGEFKMPSQVLVMSAFRHLYLHCFDLEYDFGDKSKKDSKPPKTDAEKIEEVMQILTDIKYPQIGDISKTKLSAPGSSFNWPPVCAMLHWMVCIKRSLELPTTKYHGGPLERPLSEDDEDFCHYFPYLWLCYEQFWDGQNEYPEEKARLEEIFEERAKQARQELEQLLEAERHLSARLKEFQASEPPLAVEETENAVLKSDVEKFLAYKEKVLEPRILQCETGAEEFRRESEKHEGRLHRLSRDRDILQEQVDAQNVSANDFEQMSRQREQLGELLKKVMARLQDQSSENSHTEISLSNKQSRVEDELKDLSDKCRELGMFPYTLPNGGQLFDFDIVAGNTSTMLPKGLDLRNDLRRRIAEKKEKLLSLYRKVTSEKIKDQEDFDVMMEDVGEKREETTKLERKVETVNEQTDSMKTSWKVESLDQAKVDADNDLTFAQMNQAGRNTLDLAEKRLQSAQMQITQVRDRDDEMREELVKEYTKGLETIFSLKTDVAEAFKLMEEAISKQER